MSSKDNTPEAFDEFELPEDPELHTPGHHHVATGHGFEEPGFGEEGAFDFENAPEAPVHTHAVHRVDDGFGDVDEAGTHLGGHYVDPEHDGLETEREEELQAEADEGVAPRKTPLSRYLLPVGAGILGLGLLGAWQTGMFNESVPAPVQVASAPRPAVVPPGPLPHIPASPVLPSASVAPPQMPAIPTSAPVQPAVPTSRPADGMVPAAQDDMQAAIKALVDSSAKLNATVETRFNGFDQRLSQLSTSLGARMDKADGRMDDMTAHMTADEGRLGTIEARMNALESSPQARASRRDAIPTAGPVVQRPRATAREVRPSETHGGMGGYALRGVAQGDAPATAWVKTPGGFMLVGIGQELNGAGKVTAIRHAGRSWELVTTEGVIRP
jgi:hypothetical protein